MCGFFDTIANVFFRLFRISTVREDGMTSEDIFAVVEAGAEAGVLKTQEHYLIENIFRYAITYSDFHHDNA